MCLMSTPRRATKTKQRNYAAKRSKSGEDEALSPLVVHKTPPMASWASSKLRKLCRLVCPTRLLGTLWPWRSRPRSSHCRRHPFGSSCPRCRCPLPGSQRFHLWPSAPAAKPRRPSRSSKFTVATSFSPALGDPGRSGSEVFPSLPASSVASST